MDEDLHARITSLAQEEHHLRAAHSQGDVLSGLELMRMQQLEVELDQAWDLLRQRDALRRAGRDPSLAAERDAATVEGYLS